MEPNAVANCEESGHGQATVAAGSLSRRERGGVRGYKLSIGPRPLTPTLSPQGRGSPAVPRLEAVFTNRVSVKKNQASSSVGRLLAFIFALTLLGAPSFVAAAYPERPVTIVVPFAPGGANDVVVRAIQQPLAEALGQPIVIENR